MTRFITIALVLMVATICAGHVNAQFCGGSTRIIRLEGPTGDPLKVRARYELFYLMPTNRPGEEHREHPAFLNEFFGDDSFVWDYQSLSANKKDATFIEVEKSKAVEYLRTYNSDDFKDIYSKYWRKQIRTQMNGKFRQGILKLKTSELDSTTFIMAVTAAGYETRYLAASFLGGCFDPDNRHPQKIVLSSLSLYKSYHNANTPQCCDWLK